LHSSYWIHHFGLSIYFDTIFAIFSDHQILIKQDMYNNIIAI